MMMPKSYVKKKERERLEKKNFFNDLVIFNLAEKNKQT
jgi:hypothetical protein